MSKPMTIKRTAKKLEAQAAEISVLGAVLLENRALAEVRSLITSADMEKIHHGLIFAAMCDMSDRGDPIDPITLSTEVEAREQLDAVGGVEYINQLALSVVTDVNIEHHARLIMEASELRRLVADARAVVAQVEAGHYESPDEAAAALYGAAEGMGERAQRAPLELTLSEGLDRGLQRIQHIYENKGALNGLPTGFSDLDAKLLGLRPGQLIVLAARPAMGKSALALKLALNVAETGKTALMCTLEMTHEESIDRIYSMEARVPSEKLRTGHLETGDIERLVMQVSRMNGLPLVIRDESDQTVASIRAIAQKIKANRKAAPLGIIIVDYLQLMSDNDRRKGRNREQEIAAISRGLKKLAKDLEVPVVALSQLNRGVESRPDKRPLLSDLRESGAVEQDANIVMFVYRDEMYREETLDKGIAEVIIRKNRGGPTGTVKLAFNAPITRFADLARGEVY